MSPDSNHPRPRSSKKRRAVQTGGPATRPVRRGGARAGSATPQRGGIPGAWLAIGAVVVFAIGVALAVNGLGAGASGSAPPSSDAFYDGSGEPSSAITGSVSVVPPSAASPGSASPAGSAAAHGTNCPTSQPPAMAAGQTRVVKIETAKGQIEITVDGSLGPNAAGNFVALASCGFYDGLVFHRVVPDFVIQGGDPQGTGSGGPGYEFADDPVTVPYTRGIVAMANSGPNTNGSQFFIVLKDNDLDPNYSVFGHVTAGMEAVDAIAAAADAETPKNPIAMDKVTVSNP